MVPLAWVTDPHFDHATLSAWQRCVDQVRGMEPFGLILTGDISEAEDVGFQLARLAETLGCPIFFVLGNHDFYGDAIGTVRRHMVDLSRQNPSLIYLTDSRPVVLSETTALIGDDGWGDATRGDYHGSRVRLNDFQLIKDFVRVRQETWAGILDREGRGSAERLEQKLAELDDSVTNVLVATHVPPFRESCWYEGHTTDDHWAPFFVCGYVGDALLAHAKRFPKRRLTVLCGHTHHAGVAQLTDNLVVHTGAAAYGHPQLQGSVVWDSDRDRIVVAG